MNKIFGNKKSIIAIIIAGIVLFMIICFLMNKCSQGRDFYNVENYGAIGDGKTDSTASIQQAINECSNNGGGQVYFPPSKTFITGPVELKSNCDIHLSANSVWKANEDYTIYHISAFRENEYEGTKWLWCYDCQNLSFSGNGEINGSDKAFVGQKNEDNYSRRWDDGTKFDPRPHTLTLEKVDNLRIHDITVANSAYWTIHCIGCYDVDISHVSVKNDLMVRNCDGIDLDHTKKARISNCFIESGDDSICLKNRREFAEYGDCEDIVIENCVMSSRNCTSENGCFIGGNTPTKVHDIYFDNVNLKLNKVSNYPGGAYDARPRVQDPEIIPSKTYGLYVENGTNIVIRDFDVVKMDSFPDELYGGPKFGV